MKPTSSEVSDYLKKDLHCSLVKDKDFDSEHMCVYVLRRTSTTIFGNIYSVPLPGPFIILPNFLFYTNTPFNYHNEWSYNLEDDTSHTAVITSDRGGLIFDIPSGKVIGSFESLEEERKRSMEKQRQILEDKIRELKEKKEQSCDFNKYDCDDFKTQKEAQAVFKLCGGVTNDVHHLDRDLDGIACEWNP